MQIAEEETTEEAGEHANGEKEAASASDPSGAVWPEAAAGGDAVEMRMKDELLSRRVEHGDEPDLDAQMLRIARDRAEGLGRGAKQDRTCHGLVLERDRRESVPAR